MVALGAPPTVVSVLGAAGVFVSMDERFRMRKVSTVLAAVLILVGCSRQAAARSRNITHRIEDVKACKTGKPDSLCMDLDFMENPEDDWAYWWMCLVDA